MRGAARKGGPYRDSLGKALAEYGRVAKTLHMRAWVDDVTYRRAVGARLNVGAGRRSLARRIFFGRRGEVAAHLPAGSSLADAVSCASTTARAKRTSCQRPAWWSTWSRYGTPVTWTLPCAQLRASGHRVPRRGRGPALAAWLRPRQFPWPLFVLCAATNPSSTPGPRLCAHRRGPSRGESPAGTGQDMARPTASVGTPAVDVGRWAG